MRYFRTIVFVALLAFIGAGQVYAEREHLGLRVKTGDTFINLFGQDWQKAWEENQVWIVRDGGEPVSSPDILIEGSIIRVPSGIHLTRRALNRLDDLERRRQALANRLQQLKAQIGKLQVAPAVKENVDLCERTLNDPLAFAQDEKLVENLIARIEEVKGFGPDTTQNEVLPWRALTLGLVFLGVLVAFLIAGHRSDIRSRRLYIEAVEGLRESFGRMGIRF